MSFQTLRPQVKTLLTNLTSGGVSIFVEVAGTPKLKFTGYPSCYVVQSDNEADYNTNKENQRIYTFLVRIFYSTDSIGVDTALQRLEKIVDQVIDAIDADSLKDSTTRTIGVSMPSKYTWINTYAMPTSFGELEDEQLITAELKVRVKVIFDIT